MLSTTSHMDSQWQEVTASVRRLLFHSNVTFRLFIRWFLIFDFNILKIEITDGAVDHSCHPSSWDSPWNWWLCHSSASWIWQVEGCKSSGWCNFYVPLCYWLRCASLWQTHQFYYEKDFIIANAFASIEQEIWINQQLMNYSKSILNVEVNKPFRLNTCFHVVLQNSISSIQVLTATGGIIGAMLALSAESAKILGEWWEHPSRTGGCHFHKDFYIYKHWGWESLKFSCSINQIHFSKALLILWFALERNWQKCWKFLLSSPGDSTAWILPFTAGGFINIALITIVPDILKEKNARWLVDCHSVVRVSLSSIRRCFVKLMQPAKSLTCLIAVVICNRFNF